jgi:hypothetical protein
MQLPLKLESISNPEHRRILGEFYDLNKNKQWFHRAEFVEMHPTHMKAALEIYCMYNPVLEMKELLQFTSKYNLALEIIAFSHQG